MLGHAYYLSVITSGGFLSNSFSFKCFLLFSSFSKCSLFIRYFAIAQ